METKQIRSFRRTLRRFERLLESQLKDTCCCIGVSMAQCHALMEIEEQGETTAAALSESMGLDKSTLSRTVDGLVGIGLLERRENPDDRRYTLLSLTSQGRKICDEINSANDEHYGRVLESIPARMSGQVIESFSVLVDAITGCNAGS
jgi:DNA-binding MarR family transcriptional regulator